MSEDQLKSIAFIGGGNMARSLIGGLVRSGVAARAIRVSDPSAEQRALLVPLGVVVEADNAAACNGADVIVLAVKPQMLSLALSELESLSPGQLVISIAAGVGLSTILAGCRPNQPIVRCMPNTPALLGAGITAMYANEQVTPRHRREAQAILEAVGSALWVSSEPELDTVTAVSGSGPAYFFYLMESMIDAGSALGLDRDTATKLTLETAYGAALMAREGNTSPAELRANVTSPGGTTERALSILDSAGARGIIEDALAGAAARSRELAEEFK